METTKAAKRQTKDENVRRRLYRNTLVSALRDAAKRLTYGKERESIMKKISDLSRKGYAVIKIKDGDRAGQKIDNFTLRAEHIALRIFNRGASAILHTRFLLFLSATESDNLRRWFSQKL